jgi:hypothetical protein
MRGGDARLAWRGGVIVMAALLTVVVMLYCAASRYQLSYQRHDSRMTVARRAVAADAMASDEWCWADVSEAQAREWSRAHGRPLPPGRYSSDAVNQHTVQWCGACYLVATVQAVQDALAVRDAAALPPDERDRRTYEFDLQHALDTYSALHAPRMTQRESVGVSLAGRASPWNACMGGDPAEMLALLQRGEMRLQLLRGAARWSARADPSRAALPARGHGVRAFETVTPTPEALRSAVHASPVIAAVRSTPLWGLRDDGVTACGEGERDHVVVLVGWTTRNGAAYWIARNSWGTGRSEVWTRPSDVRRCTGADASAHHCASDRAEWRSDYALPGHFLVPAERGANCLGLYDEPSGLIAVDV